MKVLAVSRAARTLVLATLLCAKPFLATSAQQPEPLRQPESIPFELAAALVAAGGFFGQPQILVGSLPEWLERTIYIPSDGRVLGSAFLGTATVAVITIPNASDTVLAEFKRELAKRGWSAPPPTPSYGGGFRPAPQAYETSSSRMTLCAYQQTLSATSARRRGVATDVTLRLTTGTTGGVCQPPQMSGMGYRPPYPVLYNPSNSSDARMMGDCSTSISGSTGTGTTLRSPMRAEEILEHYGRQLQDSGWKSTATNAAIIGRTWTKPDSTGAPVELTLTVGTSARDAAGRDLNLQVRTLRKP